MFLFLPINFLNSKKNQLKYLENLQHIIIANFGYTKQTGEAKPEKGLAKLISRGSAFLANTDLS